MPSGVPEPRTAGGRTEGSVNDQFEQLARDGALSVLALRVFGPGVLTLAPEKLPLDLGAFRRMHRPRYVREAERLLRCGADAEEAVDEAFVQPARQWPQIPSAENPAVHARYASLGGRNPRVDALPRPRTPSRMPCRTPVAFAAAA